MAVFFWTGTEDFFIQEKYQYWVKTFTEKQGNDINISVLDGLTTKTDELIADVFTVPFLSDKRLVFIKNLPPSSKAKVDDKKSSAMIEILKEVPESTVLVFIQSEPDKRTSFYKKLLTLANTEEFNPLSPNDLNKWIKQKFDNYQVAIETNLINLFIEKAGTNLWNLHNEIAKLALYKNDTKKIIKEDIDLLVNSVIEVQNFGFANAISEKNITKALHELNCALLKNESLIAVLFSFISQIRTLLMAKSLFQPTKDDLINYCKLHPFVAQKTLANIKNFTYTELLNLYQQFLIIDTDIKNGKIYLSSQNETALALEIEKLIFNFHL